MSRKITELDLVTTPAANDTFAGVQAGENYEFLTSQILRSPVDVYNVKHYGATGDGATDDTVTIQATIDAYGNETGPTASGGIVFFPPGVYVVTEELLLYSGIHIVGSGTQATEITAENLAAGDYVFKNVNNARYFSLRDFTINGKSTVTGAGGIKVGNDSGDAGFTAYVSLLNVDVTGFVTAGAVGINLSNPSHITLLNVDAYTIPNGEALLIVANMTNAGAFHFGGCKFGEWVGTDTGCRIVNSTNVGAAVSEIVFSGCFFGGTTRGVRLSVATGGADPTRSIVFDGCHHEVDNAAAGSECMLIEEGKGISIINNAFHGNLNTENGIRFNHSGVVDGVRIEDCHFIKIKATGICVQLGSVGAGTYKNVKVNGIMTKDTNPVLLIDPNNVVTLIPSTVERNNSSVSTAGAGEDQLHLTTITQRTMGAIGGIRLTAAGTKTGANDTKTIKLKWGTQSYEVHPANNNINAWRLEATIENTTVNSQRISWVFYDGTTTRAGYQTPAENTDTGDVDVWLTGECANAGDSITQTAWLVERLGG